jgi:hypothetical protein
MIQRQEAYSYLLSQTGNANEIPEYSNMPPNDNVDQTERTIDGTGRGCKTITIYVYDIESKYYAQGTGLCGTNNQVSTKGMNNN